MEKFKNCIVINELNDVEELGISEEMETLLNETECDDLDDMLYNELIPVYIDNELTIWNNAITDDNISLYKIYNNELPALFIDYDQFLAYCNDIILYVNGNEYKVKYSLYGNIIEVLDDEIYPYFDSILEILKDIDFDDMRKFQNFKDDIDVTKPHIKVNFMPTAFNEYTCYYNVKGSEANGKI